MMSKPMTNYNERLDEVLESVFMAGLGIAGADDISPEDKDTAILNTQKYFVGEAKQAILDWHNKQIEQLVGEIEEIKLSGSNADQRRLGRNMLRKQILDKLKEANQ